MKNRIPGNQNIQYILHHWNEYTEEVTELILKK